MHLCSNEWINAISLEKRQKSYQSIEYLCISKNIGLFKFKERTDFIIKMLNKSNNFIVLMVFNIYLFK